MKYFVKTPWWIRKIFPHYVWNIETDEKILYLTFDDGPHPQITGFVLDQLKEYNAKATFFCIGKNIVSYPEMFARICKEGHAIGNHTFSHLNGLKSKDDNYLNDVAEASKYINSALFRPPYGRITSYQANRLGNRMGVPTPIIIMWDILSADFDVKITPQKSLNNVLKNSGPGSIIVFHDSEKAYPRLEISLPATLDFFKEKGFRFECLSERNINGKF